MSIKEKVAALATGVMMATAVATTGCEKNEQQEASQVKQPVAVVKTVEEEQKEKHAQMIEDHKQICKGLNGKNEYHDPYSGATVDMKKPLRTDYDEETDTCNILDTNKQIEESLYDYQDHLRFGNSKRFYDKCSTHRAAEESEDGKTFKQNVDCGGVKTLITFTNVVPLCQDLAEQCKKDKDCTCGTKKDKNGCVSCVKHIRDTVVVANKNNASELDDTASQALNFDGLYNGNQIAVDCGGCYLGDSERAQPCADDKNKYCIKDKNVTFKFHKVEFKGDSLMEESENIKQVKARIQNIKSNQNQGR